MSHQSVLSHDHKERYAGERLAKCDCARRITRKEADRRVAGGSAKWLKFPEGSFDHGHIFATKDRPLGKQPVPKAQTIGERNILRAMGVGANPTEQVSSRRAGYERNRIELYGLLNQQNLIDLGAEANTRGGSNDHTRA